MTDSPDAAPVAAVKLSAPPICDECELPQEQITHSYVCEWACATDSFAKRFQPTFEEFTEPDLLIIMGLPLCNRCHQRREMTRIGNIMRFECGNPACNELVHLISAKSAQANKLRPVAALQLARLTLVLSEPRIDPTLPPGRGRSTLSGVPPLDS